MSKIGNLSPVKPPCQHCDKRHMKCHSSCKDYKEFEKHNEAWRQKKHERLMISDAIHSNMVNRFSSMKYTGGSKIKHGGRRGA